MKNRKSAPAQDVARSTVRPRRRRLRSRPEREEYPTFVLGDGSKLDFDYPDVCHALQMAKPD